MPEPPKKDLLVLVPDINMDFTVQGLLASHHRLGVRPLTFDLYRHPHRDPGCLRESTEFLRAFSTSHRHALVMFDRQGSGQESSSREDLESELEKLLEASGWGDRAAVIVLDPELEVWVWSDSPRVDDVLGWKGKQPDLRTWLAKQGFVETTAEKPRKPKEAFRSALRMVRKPPSSALFRELAQRVGLARCTDPSLEKLLTTLRGWFPPVS
jgi:hypothetical protein